MIPDLVLKSISKNTVRSYSQGLRSWNNWRKLHPEINQLPVHEFHLALYIASAIQSNQKYGRVENVYCGLNWLHKALDLPNPCESTMVQVLKEAAKRLLSKPVRKKEPISPHDLKRLVNHLKDGSLIDLRTLAVAVVSYAGFLRYDELSSLRFEYISFKPTHMQLFINCSKVDQHNVGDYVHIAKTGRKTCPVAILQAYLEKAKITSSGFIFRGVSKVKDGHKLRKADKPISYTSLREDVLRAIDGIGLDRKRFGLHSMRRGGATYAANNGVSDRLFKKHGRWSSEGAKDGYVAEDLSAMLSVSRNLGI